jgi:hypothetical protein
MKSDAHLGAAWAATLFLGFATLRSAAAADIDACTLLTPAQVGAAVGVAVGDGTHVTASFVRTCTWNVTGSSDVKTVTLLMQTAATYDGGKQMAAQIVASVKGSAVTPARVGDDAYFFVTGDQSGLLVKKGANSFKVTVYAKLPLEKKEAMELALAKDVVAKI